MPRTALYTLRDEVLGLEVDHPPTTCCVRLSRTGGVVRGVTGVSSCGPPQLPPMYTDGAEPGPYSLTSAEHPLLPRAARSRR